jgi:Ca-activated chloride channel family protein
MTLTAQDWQLARPRPGLLLGVLAALLLPIQTQAAGSSVPVFRTGAKIVLLQATVRNARGELVTGLGPDAFTVYENGKKQTIDVFRHEDVPVSLGILIDNSGSMRKLRASVEAAALDCVRASNPKDEVFVLNFADKTHIDVPFTSDLQVLEAGIAGVDSIGGTAMYDALQAAADYLRDHARQERRALLVVTDGIDNASVATLRQIRTLAEQSEIVIYAIGLLGDENESRAGRARHELEELTATTGGAAYYPSGAEALEEVALSIARQIRSQYVLGFTPAEGSLDGSFRKLRVVARGQGRLAVRTRAGYRAIRHGLEAAGQRR